MDKYSKKAVWRVLRGIAEGPFSLREGEKFSLDQLIQNQKDGVGEGGINPPQPTANGQMLSGQNAGSGSTGGSALSDEQEHAPKTAHAAINPPQISAADEEREVFTL